MIKRPLVRKPQAKRWYAIRCDVHGVKPKGQSYGEVKVSAGKPGSRMGSRAVVACPICAAIKKGDT